jgi:hypothetical protein
MSDNGTRFEPVSSDPDLEVKRARSRRISWLLVAGLVVLGAFPVTLGIIGRDQGKEMPQSREENANAAPAAQYSSLYGSVCGLVGLAEQDPPAAHREFMNQAHGPIHDLVDAVANRSVKARLLEAKGSVESAGDSGPLTGQMQALADATRQAVIAAGSEDPGPCP